MDLDILMCLVEDKTLMEHTAVIPKFIKQLLNDEAPTIHGDGTK